METVGYPEDSLERTLEVVIPATESSSELEISLKALRQRINIRGFRRGKAPLNVIRNMHGRHIAGDVLNELAKIKAQEALKEKNEEPITTPSIDLPEKAVETILAQEDLKFDIKYEVAPTVDIEELSNIEVERPIVQIDDAEAEDYIKVLAKQNRTFEPRQSTEVSENGDQLEILLAMKKDGITEEAGAEKIKVVLGSSSLLGDEENKLIGTKIGDVRELRIEMPEADTSKGNQVPVSDFSATILEIAKPVETKIDDELAQSLGLDSLEQLREYVKSSSVQEYKSLADDYMMMQIRQKLLSKLKFPISKKLLENEVRTVLNGIADEYEEAGRPASAAKKLEQENMGKIMNQAVARTRWLHIGLAVVKKFNIQVDEKDIDDGIRKIASFSKEPISPDSLKKWKKDEHLVNQIASASMDRKIEEQLISSAKLINKTMSGKELFAAIADFEKGSDSASLDPQQAVSS